MTSAYSSTEARRTYAVEAGGAATESMGGIVVVVLAILALAGVASALLTPIAGIVFGAAFIVEGAAIISRHQAIMSQMADAGASQLEIGGGVTVELVAGLSAIVLGILSLIGVAGAVLMPVLVIVGGVGVILASGVALGLNQIRGAALAVDPGALALARTAVSSAAAGQVLAGLAAVVLGILALVGVGYPAVLTTVGMLVLGAAITLTGAALSGRLLRLFSRS